MRTVIDSIKCDNGLSVDIVPDFFCDSPRENCEHDSVIFSNHRHYNPDNRSIEELLDENGNLRTRELDKDYIYLPIYAYEHSGIALSTERTGCFADRWDSGMFGIIAISKASVRKNWCVKRISKKMRENVCSCLKAEVAELSAWYNGECYGYEVMNSDGDCLESCYGYIGYESIEDAKADGLDIARCIA